MLKAWTGALALAALTATPALAAPAAGSYTSLTVFGDSLVDSGNFLHDTAGAIPNPLTGYFPGRWTNGYDYTDLLSFSLFGTPTLDSQDGGSNYAYGGARILDTVAFPPNLPDQYARFQARVTAGTAGVDPNGLVVLNFGANDLFNIASTANDPTQPNLANPYNGDQNRVLVDAAQAYANFVQTLNDQGFRNILITSFPLGTAQSNTADGYLTADLDALTLDPGTTLFRFNYVDAFSRILADPTAYGVAPFTHGQNEPCQSGGPAAIQSGCAGYFVFDGVHPIATVQRALFNDINRQFALVSPDAAAAAGTPEPGSWAMLILGFAMVGAGLRARRVEVRFRAA